MAHFLIPKDREILKHLLSLAGGDIALVERVLRESDVPRGGSIRLGSIANVARGRSSPKRST